MMQQLMTPPASPLMSPTSGFSSVDSNMYGGGGAPQLQQPGKTMSLHVIVGADAVAADAVVAVDIVAAFQLKGHEQVFHGGRAYFEMLYMSENLK